MSKRSSRPSVVPRPVAEVWSAGLGALGATRKRGAEGFEALVARGRAVQDSGEHAAREALDLVERAASAAAGHAAQTLRDASAETVDTVQGRIEAAVERVLSVVGVPARDDVAVLRARVDALTARIALFDGSPAEEAADAEPEAAFAVAVHPDGWAVRRVGSSRALSVHATKKEATVAGRQAAKAHAPSRLTLYRADGSAGETVDYGVAD